MPSVIQLMILTLLSNQNTIRCHENGDNIQCHEDKTRWRMWIFTGTRCNVQCSTDCTFILDEVQVTSNCTHGNVSAILIPYPSKVRYLSWDDSTLHVIQPHSFNKYSSTLELLYLNSIGVLHLQPGVFHGLSNLIVLDLQHNNLTMLIPGIFEELIKLQELRLGNNQLTAIQSVFKDLVRLEELYLENNKLHDIKDNMFEELHQLQKLRLSENMLSEVQDGAFKGLKSLSWLTLNSNQINGIVVGAFAHLVGLQQLYLMKNMLPNIQVGMFLGLKGLRKLYLDGNELHEIEPSAFADMGSLQRLHLSNNVLQRIQACVFIGLTSLERLYLDTNKLQKIDTGAFEGLERLDGLFLHNNMLVEIQTGVFTGLTNLIWLILDNNMLCLIESGVSTDLTTLSVLELEYNDLTNLASDVFVPLKSLVYLVLSHNKLTSLHPDLFKNLTNIVELKLQNNQLQYLPENIFHSLQQLELLNLSSNNLQHIPSKLFVSFTNIHLRILDLQENPLFWIEAQALSSVKAGSVVVSSYAPCCFVTMARCKSPPRSQYLTCKRLLPYNFLRVAIWFVCSFAILGNLFVLFTRFRQKQQSNKVQFFLITNLSVSDFFMGIYLIILLSVDLYYKEYFPTHSEAWRSSVLCRIAGAISVLSSEASAFFITLITIDRFLGVKYTFSKFRLSTKSTRIVVALLWFIAFGISISVYILAQTESDIYAVSEVCVGLPISRSYSYTENEIVSYPRSPFSKKERAVFYTQTSSKVSMILSIGIFIGLNSACFIIVGYCYIAIFVYVRRTTKESGRPANINAEIRMAMKMSLIVLTDFCCWVPIGILSILVQTGAVWVDPVAYAWIATFVLPINSSINPFLYTLASYILDKVKWSCKRTWKRNTKQCIQMNVAENQEPDDDDT